MLFKIQASDISTEINKVWNIVCLLTCDCLQPGLNQSTWYCLHNDNTEQFYVLLGRAVTEYRWGGSRNIPLMRHRFPVLTVKKLLKSVYIYGSYRKIKTGVSLFWTTRYIPYTRGGLSTQLVAATVAPCIRSIKCKGRYSSSWEPHPRATGRHLPYVITQCYLPPNTSERAPP